MTGERPEALVQPGRAGHQGLPALWRGGHHLPLSTGADRTLISPRLWFWAAVFLVLVSSELLEPFLVPHNSLFQELKVLYSHG